jgi:hypothetical protein
MTTAIFGASLECMWQLDKWRDKSFCGEVAKGNGADVLSFIAHVTLLVHVTEHVG